MQVARSLQVSILVLAFQLLSISLWAQKTGDKTITNADVVKMTQAGIPESIIMREIQTSKTDFGTSPTALIELKKQGVSEKVLGAVLDSHVGGGASPEQPLTGHATTHTGGSGSHHVRSFQADLRTNSKALGTFSFNQNRIKFERAGVPVFSLKWSAAPKQ